MKCLDGMRYEVPKDKLVDWTENSPNRSWRRTPGMQMVLKEDMLMERVSRAIKAWVQQYIYSFHIDNMSHSFSERSCEVWDWDIGLLKTQKISNLAGDSPLNEENFPGLGHVGMKCIACVGKQVFWGRCHKYWKHKFVAVIRVSRFKKKPLTWMFCMKFGSQKEGIERSKERYVT